MMNLFTHLKLPVEWGMAMRFASWTEPAWNSFADGAGAKRQRHCPALERLPDDLSFCIICVSL